MNEEETVPLREHLEQRLADDHARLSEAIAAVERILLARIEAKATEFHAIHAGSQLAIAKAEVAIEKRFEAANEWRGQSADRERTQVEEIAKLSVTFARSATVDAQLAGLRETMDAQLGEVRRMVTALAEKVSQVV